MGRQVVHTVMRDSELVFTGGLVKAGQKHISNDDRFEDCCEQLGVAITENLNDLLEFCDVLIDFSTPDTSIINMRACSRYGKPMVIGSTGFTHEDSTLIQELARNIPVVYSPNMSVGVNVISKILQEVARILGDDFDVEILEVHHRKKKDNPSGTALHLAEIVANALGRDLNKVASYFREGTNIVRAEKEIGMQVVRGGDIVGDHTVYFIGKGEQIEITHRAHNREMFSHGAVKAAKWVVNREPGLYSLKDVLGLK
jgi:4-hydroxy-tetrahydrodipicolinate reductase